MRIAVYGAGGVGGYFGGRLAQAGADVHFIARGAHLQALREQGLRVRSVTGDFEVRAPATDDPADVGSCDFVLFCVKTFDTDAAAARLGPLVGEDTAVVSLQNGVENEETLARAVGDDHVMGGAAFIFAEIAEPGVIRHTGGPASITFGELDGRASERAQRLLSCCEQAGVAAELSGSIKTVLWAKLAFICAQARHDRRGAAADRGDPHRSRFLGRVQPPACRGMRGRRGSGPPCPAGRPGARPGAGAGPAGQLLLPA
jgi:2-dehydropantoate 2-reductase